jgi:hypothetical protein
VLDRDYNVTVEVSIPAESRLVLTVRRDTLNKQS